MNGAGGQKRRGCAGDRDCAAGLAEQQEASKAKRQGSENNGKCAHVPEFKIPAERSDGWDQTLRRRQT